MTNIYQQGLEQVAANSQPLSPVNFLNRTADTYPDKIAIIHGKQEVTYREFRENSRRLTSALIDLGVKPGDTVSILAANIPAFIYAHYGVPATGAVLNSINYRLDATAIAFILDHSECSILMVDTAFYQLVRDALKQTSCTPLVINIDDLKLGNSQFIGELEFDALLNIGDKDFTGDLIHDEWQALALNYTSGTTGNPKGVVYSHRGAYLNAVGNNMVWPLTSQSVYLWTLPMFHCNGWCFPWTVVAMAGTQVCLRQVCVDEISQAMIEHHVSHFCGAPIVLNMILNGPQELRDKLPRGIKAMTAGAPPPAAVIKGMEAMGFDITQGYGLTEVYGPCVVSEWKKEWNDLPADTRAALKARQGVRYPTQEEVNVLDPDTMVPVPADAETIGEIMFRGNTTMKGYLKNPNATNESFKHGWFHSGDLAVKHSDGFIEIRDRSKDIIISGGENISSVEVESTLYQHPAVLEAAVVARKDDTWGETPCAFVGLKDDKQVTEQELIDFCRQHMASFKAPKTIVFSELPKTSTGKVQKFVLRQKVKTLFEG